MLFFGIFLWVGCASEAPPSSKLGLGGSCGLAGSAGCVSGFCAQLDTGAAVCTVSCGAESMCPGGWTCRQDRSPSVCVPAATSRDCTLDRDCPASHRCSERNRCVIPAARELCVACSDQMQCAEGLVCSSLGDGLADSCLTPCQSGDCAEGSDCVDGACIPLGRCGVVADLCAACRRDSECGGRDDYCVRNLQLGRSFCASDCSETACPDGFRCQDFDFGQQCVPADGQCQDRCLGDADCPHGFLCTDGRCSHQPDHQGLCAPCGDSGDCQNGLCVQGADGRSVCAPRCVEGANCPNGSVCAQLGGSEESACLPRTGKCPVGVGATGRRCSASEDCASGLCLRAEGVGSGRCVDACVSGQCPAGQQCRGLGGAEICIGFEGADGAPCSSGATCSGGLCVSLASESICSRSCSPDTPCAEGWACKAVAGDRMACLPQTQGGDLGAMCHAGASACESSLCLIKRTGPVCTRRCDERLDCPENWGCLSVEGRGMPEGGATVCVPVEEG